MTNFTKHWKSTAILIVLGLLVSAGASSKKEDAVVLTADNHISFVGPVTDSSVASAQIALGKISKKLEDDETIYLVLDTPGGSVSAGNLFIDYANSLPQKIKPICLFCASMGYHMFQSFGERLVFESSTLMSHRAAMSGLAGQVPGELETRLNSIKSILDNMDGRVAKRVGMSKEAYKALIYDELWLDGLSAVKSKHADKVAKMKCSKDIIAATDEQTFQTLFGPVRATFSKCPLISGAIDIKFDRKLFRSVEEATREVVKVKRKIVMEY